MKKLAITIFFLYNVLLLSKGNAEESFTWFNSCSTAPERDDWKLGDSALLQNDSLYTTSRGAWCRCSRAFNLSRMSMNWMVKLKGGDGGFQVALSSGNELVWGLSCAKKNAIEGYVWTSQVDTQVKIDQVNEGAAHKISRVPFNVWMPLSIVKRPNGLEIFLNHRMLEKINISPSEMPISFKSTGTLLAECDEFEVKAISPEMGNMDDTTLEKGSKLPDGWKQVSGIWSTAFLPRSNRLVVCQSMDTHAELVYGEEMIEGSSVTAEMRFEGKGQVGLGIRQINTGQDFRVMLRQNVNYGIIGEQVNVGNAVMAFRTGASVYSNIWYSLKMQCRLGRIVVEMNGNVVGDFDATTYGRPYLISDGAPSALFKDIKVKGIKASGRGVMPMDIDASIFKNASWPKEIQNIFVPNEASPYVEMAGQMSGPAWQTSWTWWPDKSKCVWLRWSNSFQTFEINLVPMDQQIEVVMFYRGNEDLKPRVELPTGILSRMMRGREDKFQCIFWSSLKSELWVEGINVNLKRSSLRSKNKVDIILNGSPLGEWLMLGDGDFTLSVGSEGLSKVINFVFQRDKENLVIKDVSKLFKVIVGNIKRIGGAFDDENLEVGQSVALSTMLMENSELSWNMGPREKGGKMSLNVVDGSGHNLFTSVVDFSEASILNWIPQIPKNITEVTTACSGRWDLGLKRVANQLLLKINEKDLRSVELPKGFGPLSVEWGLIEGDFIFENQTYSWNNAKYLDLLDASRQKSLIKNWDFALPLSEESNLGKTSHLGPLGKMALKEKLGMNHQIFLVSRSTQKFLDNRKHSLEWISDSKIIRVSISILDDGCDVQWSVNDTICGSRRVRVPKIQLLAGFDAQKKFQVWLLGEPLGDSVDVGVSDWSFIMRPDSARLEQFWSQMLWTDI